MNILATTMMRSWKSGLWIRRPVGAFKELEGVPVMIILVQLAHHHVSSPLTVYLVSCNCIKSFLFKVLPIFQCQFSWRPLQATRWRAQWQELILCTPPYSATQEFWLTQQAWQPFGLGRKETTPAWQAASMGLILKCSVWFSQVGLKLMVKPFSICFTLVNRLPGETNGSYSFKTRI